MDATVSRVNGVTVIALSGDIDGSSAPIAQARILEQIVAGEGLILDMSDVQYMSSAGLRMLLSAHRSATAKSASVILVGLSENLQDTMAATGFLDFFHTYAALPEAMASLAKE
jgi:anti-sigma B factor antagonist